ncbi:uncharacterized protein IL334_004762 [Kwoniella shivajii]|uniref:protein-tyrosine-phosphatase n=1 Tax=Kwoniella shivajii TaxID=564305 RepID=A0ABZ1D1E4_9TREE|nr:hypothetical protein IL334_004762 [Kwoniella shivajii]
MSSSNGKSRPKLPIRSISTLISTPPSDAAKSDDDAVLDVYREVNSTGSLQAAAKKLEQYASSTSTSTSTSTKTKAKPKFDEDPEEVGFLQQHSIDEDALMFDDNETEDNDDESKSVDNDRRDDRGQVVHLQEVVDGLWIGDLVSAMDIDGLEKRGISNILSLLRPTLKFPSSFSVYPLEIDDSADTDILTHLPSCVAWIQSILSLRERSFDISNISEETESAEKDPTIAKIAGDPKPGGVLVHCQAGMSRSATVVAAYLMREYDLDPVQALVALREKRPVVDPSETFWHQLGLFYNADGRVSLKDKSTRRFYMERTASQFMNGDGGAPSMATMAKYPATPSASNPPTPGGIGRRQIRCKMCRRQLAVREHMMDHILDQQPISRPRTPSNATLPSPRLPPITSGSAQTQGLKERRPSVVSDVINPLTGLPGRRSSHASLSGFSLTQTEGNPSKDSSGSSNGQNTSSMGGIPLPKRSTTTPGLTLTASSPEVANQPKLTGDKDLLPSILGRLENPSSPKPMTSTPPASTAPAVPGSGSGSGSSERVFRSAEELSSRLPPHLLALRMAGSGSSAGGGGTSSLSSPIGSSPTSSPEKDISAQSQTFPPSSNVNSASRRLSLLSMTPKTLEGNERRGSMTMNEPNGGYPILVNQKCSGYFVEPLTWMEPVLQNGDIAGKLICPNEKCGVKIGNFDWAGVQCGCREWVTPGFCIHRSKVDEVW